MLQKRLQRKKNRKSAEKKTFQALVRLFIARFCAHDISGLRVLLDEQLHFEGPWLQCTSREDYLHALKNNVDESSLRPRKYRILSMAQNNNQVLVFYAYEKQKDYLLVGQLCTFKRGRISDILLVFDTKHAEMASKEFA